MTAERGEGFPLDAMRSILPPPIPLGWNDCAHARRTHEIQKHGIYEKAELVDRLEDD